MLSKSEKILGFIYDMRVRFQNIDQLPHLVRFKTFIILTSYLSDYQKKQIEEFQTREDNSNRV